MASKKSFLTNQSYIFSNINKKSSEEESMFEFDEAELYDSCTPPKKGGGNSITGLKKPSRKNIDGRVSKIGPASLPVNIPNWPKILEEKQKKKKKKNRKWESYGDGDDDDDDEDESDDERVPPHEYLARTRGASLSVHEGFGRTLKGRDLCSVRNEIWKRVGFED
ncbi:unnamed protein product [Vicia faba]|uniref:Senescence regulator n=1 Tax=Vicia faba TaxID=3906 RepID=A0AAV0ZW32_VICFA|nr:unnamed protein product [Vicia faba]